jgi:clan AA aspartic protease (TIGR02281 family)
MRRRLPFKSTFGAGLALLGAAFAAYARLCQPVEMTAASVIAAEADFDEPIRAHERDPGRTVGLLVKRASNGMFYTHVTVNGHRTKFLIDTGASMIVLSRADAKAMRVDLADADHGRPLRAVGGQSRATVVRLASIELAGRRLENVEAAIVDEGVGAPLLGQNALVRLEGLTIRGDRMYLY